MHILACVLLTVCQASIALTSLCNLCETCAPDPDDHSVPCKCSSRCNVYGNCCDSLVELSNCTGGTVYSSGVEFTCRSIFVDSNILPQQNGAFWMVSSCPNSWSTDVAIQVTIRDNCSSLSSSLPPVTDLDTGTVYANEFCAICNGVVDLLAWQPNLVCSSSFRQSSLAYGIDLVLKMYPNIFQTDCQTCSYKPPTISTIARPRPCIHAISTCLSKSDLESVSRRQYTEDSYTILVDECVGKPVNFVASYKYLSFSTTIRIDVVVFKNSGCAECNAINNFVSICHRSPSNRSAILRECVPRASSFNLSSSPPVTILSVNNSRLPDPYFPCIDPSPAILPYGLSLLEDSLCVDMVVDIFNCLLSTEGLDTYNIFSLGSLCIQNSSSCSYFFRRVLLECVTLSSQNVTPYNFSSGQSISKPDFKRFIISLLEDPQCVKDVSSVLRVGQGCGGPSDTPFTIAFSNFGKGQVDVSVDTELVALKVDCPEGQIALGFSCIPTICPQVYEEDGGVCVFPLIEIDQDSSECFNLSDYIQVTNDTLLSNDLLHTVIDETTDGQPIVCLNSSFPANCSTGLVALNSSDFDTLSNSSILFEKEVYDVIKFDSIGRAIICPPNSTTILRNTTVYSYPDSFFILTYIGCSLSVIGCALVLLTYGLFKSLRTLPSLILMNLVTAILATNLLFVIGGPVAGAFPSMELCTVVAISLHFFYLAQFVWMCLMSFQMAKTFYQAWKLTSVPNHNKYVFFLYFLLGWGIPLAVTTVSIIVDFTTDSLVSYGVPLDEGQLGCWISHFESAIVAFLVPLVLTVIINLTLFVVVTVFLCLAARSSSKVNGKPNLHFVRVNAATFSVTGLTWLFGFIALLVGTSWAWYPFIIFHSTQGFAIFVSFIFTRHVLRLYRDLLLCRKSNKSSTNSKFVGNGSQAPSGKVTTCSKVNSSSKLTSSL